MDIQYMLFYTGLASTPNSVGLMDLTNDTIVCRISCSRPTGKETRKCYEKYVGILKRKYQQLV